MDKAAEDSYQALKESDHCKDLRLFDLPNLDTLSFKRLLGQLAHLYKESHKTEISHKISIHDKSNTIKNDKDGEDWKLRLNKMWQLVYIMKSFDDEVTQAITIKCSGNPLLCLQYFVNLL